MKKTNAVNFWGFLKSPEEEAKYFQHEHTVASSLVSRVIIAFGVAFFLIYIFDFGYCARVTNLDASLGARIVILISSLIFAILVRVVKKQFCYYMLLVLFSGIVAISYVYILVEQNVSDLGYHGMGIMAILICISLLRIPWAYLLVTNTTIIAFFLLCSYFLMERVPISNYIEVTTYFIIVILFTSIIQKQMSTEQREKYLQGENLRLLSVTDKLTGCYNRLWFDSKLKEFSFFRDDDPGSKFSIIMLDVDNFKKVNDTHGHLVGDRVLQECVDLVRGVSRPKDYCARWGGEEFIVLLPTTQIEEATAVAERMRSAIELYDFSLSFALTCSFGVVARRPGEDSDSLLHRADTMLYRAKRNGKNRVEKDDLIEGSGAVFLHGDLRRG